MSNISKVASFYQVTSLPLYFMRVDIFFQKCVCLGICSVPFFLICKCFIWKHYPRKWHHCVSYFITPMCFMWVDIFSWNVLVRLWISYAQSFLIWKMLSLETSPKGDPSEVVPSTSCCFLNRVTHMHMHTHT